MCRRSVEWMRAVIVSRDMGAREREIGVAMSICR